jgi:hypothetical protein
MDFALGSLAPEEYKNLSGEHGRSAGKGTML